MAEKPLFIKDLQELLDSLPPDSILSRTIYQDETIKTVLFGFQPGQELSEHTASVPAVLHFLKGEAEVVLGDDHHQAHSGTWIHIPANLSHSIHAVQETLMLLSLLRRTGEDS
jgi:quercetin dioxygenase-like cupin family protein